MSKTITDYQNQLRQIDKGSRSRDYTSMLILAVVEELGEMARAYLAQSGRKGKHHRARQDETYKQELGDIMVAIIKLANIKKIDLDKQIQYSLKKLKSRKKKKLAKRK